MMIEGNKTKFLLVGLSISFILFQIIYYFTAKLTEVDSIPIGIESILIFTYVFLLFFEQFQSSKNKYIYNYPWFWVIIGILIYLSCSFFFYILVNFDRKMIGKYWHLTYVFETIKNLLITVTIYMYSRQSERKPPQKNIPYLDLI